MLNCTTNAVFCVKNYLKYASIPANFCLEYDIIYAICQMPLGIQRCPTKNKIKNLSQNNPFRQTLLFQNMLAWREYVQNNPEYEYFKDSPYIFPSRESEFMSYSAMKSRVNRFLKSSGVGKKLHYSAYRFRHTFCTNLALSGAPLALTMQLMGDKSSDIVLNVYTNISSQQAVEEARSYCNF